MMMRSDFRCMVFAVLTAGLLAGRSWTSDTPIADKDLAVWLQKRIEQWQPIAEEKRFDEIGWAADIRDALRLGKEHNRPIFLFTHDGHMHVGRC
jgi:hypothetical protein